MLYDNLIPGSPLVNKLEDLGYRVAALHEPSLLTIHAQQQKPLVVLADLESTRGDVCAAISNLRRNPTTRHLPVIAFGPDSNTTLQQGARTAGATLVVNKSGLLDQLEVLLDQALSVE